MVYYLVVFSVINLKFRELKQCMLKNQRLAVNLTVMVRGVKQKLGSEKKNIYFNFPIDNFLLYIYME